MPLRTPISATIVEATFIFNKIPVTVPIGIKNYAGRGLYIHPIVSNKNLTMTINEDPPLVTAAPTEPATTGDGTVTSRVTTVPFKLPQNIDYAAGSKLTLTVRLTSDLKQAFLTIDDVPRTIDTTLPHLRFILVEDNPNAEPRFRFEYIQNEIVIDKVSTRVDASVVPPNPNEDGAVLGPMGFSTP